MKPSCQLDIFDIQELQELVEGRRWKKADLLQTVVDLVRLQIQL